MFSVCRAEVLDHAMVIALVSKSSSHRAYLGRLVGQIHGSPESRVHLARAQFLRLGERHDNADHYRLQAEVLRRLITGITLLPLKFCHVDTTELPLI